MSTLYSLPLTCTFGSESFFGSDVLSASAKWYIQQLMRFYIRYFFMNSCIFEWIIQHRLLKPYLTAIVEGSEGFPSQKMLKVQRMRQLLKKLPPCLNNCYSSKWDNFSSFDVYSGSSRMAVPSKSLLLESALMSRSAKLACFCEGQSTTFSRCIVSMCYWQSRKAKQASPALTVEKTREGTDEFSSLFRIIISQVQMRPLRQTYLYISYQ